MQKRQIYIYLFILSLLHAGCRKEKSGLAYDLMSRDLEQIQKSDTLKVVTMTGPTSYFLYRDEEMGYDFEMTENLADFLNVNIEITVVRSEREMEQLLQQRKVDLVMYNIFETKQLKKHFNFVFPQQQSYQVLVQNIGANSISDVTELEDKTVYAKPTSIFHKRLIDLNQEIGGKIKIAEAADSLTSDDLIEMVGNGKIAYTVAYYRTALLFKSYYTHLDCRMPIGFNQKNGWLIRKESNSLRKAIERWEKLDETQRIESALYNKYWFRSPFFAMKKVRIPKGSISPFDHFFKKYAPEINWDWRLLAAVAFHESRFDSTQVSWAGAAGIMQLMPRTASNLGLSRRTVFNPEKNIEAGVQYIKSLNMSFRKVENKEERIKFILAAYNSGPAHILDAMALTQKYGRNPQVWYNNVEYYLLKKSEPEFYNDPVVKYGHYRGTETVHYVRSTLDTYYKYSGKK